MTQPLLFDLPAADPTRHRHKGNPNSEQAFEKVKKSVPNTKAQILALIAIAGFQGMTIHEICSRLSFTRGRAVTPNMISGRLTDLAHKDLAIYVQGERNGAGVYRTR